MRLTNFWQVIIFLIGVLFVVGLGRNLWRLWRAGERLTRAEAQLKTLRAENKHLKQESLQLNNPAFLEKQIRDKLNMAKPGEMIVLLPFSEIQSTIEEPKAKDQEQIEPIWRQWLKLFW